MNSGAHQLRQVFLKYFADHGHAVVPSSSLIPQADPTLLFTNAGMNQFKPLFLGEERRVYTRAASVQKCVRAGGKHNDLENVGYTARHHTFFEMLGNFSFGDYFKEDAIAFGWEFLTTVVGLPKERLWITVYKDDDEAYELWRKMGVATSRVIRCGEKDNFWQMGDTGPCGPCSEIHLDQGPAVPGDDVPNGEGDRVIEIWNLVFMQYNQSAGGQRVPLPKPSIDTGMGLERLAAVAQGVHSNYETDLFKPLLDVIGTRAGKQYGKDGVADRSMRVIADHLRAMTFLISDGVLPSNEGRGYVVRRIMRRAARHGRLLGLDQPFLFGLTRAVVEHMAAPYPELRSAADTVAQVTQVEEERFIATLDQGLPILTELISKARASGRTQLPGGDVFKLYDTYGFPLDLMTEAAREQGMALDEAGFSAALDEQRERARKTGGFEMAAASSVETELASRLEPTQFVGYDHLLSRGRVQALLKVDRLVNEAREGDEIEVALDVTPFYAVGGGQVGDRGVLLGPEGRIEVQETTRPVADLILHKGVVRAGQVRVGETLQAQVEVGSRLGAARHHTGTHLVHAALREVLGPHVRQLGSLVAPQRLRFDFSHFRPLSSRDVDDIEALVNERIIRNDQVQTKVMGLEEAVAAGALAFFGDKYGNQVRVVSINSFSKELCGGTHCRATGEVGLFRLTHETGVAAGVRRIEAVTAGDALAHVKRLKQDLEELSALLKVGPGEVVQKARKLVAQLKEKERELEQVKLRLAGGAGAETSSRSVKGVHVHAQRADGLDQAGLRTLGDQLRDRVTSGVIALGSAVEGKVTLLVIVSKDLLPKLKAGELIKEMAAEVGGTGGGRPEMAQAGGRDPARLDAALEKVFTLVEHAIR